MSVDGILSGYFYALHTPGFHSILLEEIPVSDEIFNSSFLEPAYTTVGRSFYVTNPRNDTVGDEVPPARITDLKVTKINAEEHKATFNFTEPGNDYLDNGGNYSNELPLFLPLSFSSFDVFYILWRFR